MVDIKVLEVKKFCFCIPLEIGATIFAFIHLIVSALVLAYVLKLQVGYFLAVGIKHDLETINFFLQLTDVGVTLQIVFGIYLLIGLYERSPAFVLTWLLYEVISVVIGISIVILEAGFGHQKNWRLSLFYNYVEDELIFIVTYLFFCAMIYGVYKKFSRERDEKSVQVKWSSSDSNQC